MHRFFIVSGLLVSSLFVGAAEVQPWTNKPHLDDPQEFHFAIVPDRTGSERKGFFEKTMGALNLLRPEFTICVGDLIDGVWKQADGVGEARRQQRELGKYLDILDMRFYCVVGNHDINVGWPGNTRAHDCTKQVWHETWGKRTYYDFMYKGCHFVCLDSMDGRDGTMPLQGITDAQYAWARQAIADHRDARWTFIFMHMPLDWTSDKWLAFERDINSLNYTVFCGDWHNHVKAVRHGKNYYMIGTAGGGFDYSVKSDDLRYGIMDSITWVTVTKKGPVVANLQLSGIFNDEVQRCSTTKGWMETPLDYPDGRDGLPGKYVGISNPAVVPAERMSGDGYDWHFRHALLLRNNDFILKPDVVLAGDGTFHAWCPNWYGDRMYGQPECITNQLFKTHRVMNMGFAGDKTQNLLWRLRHGELDGTTPKCIALEIGHENLLAGNTPMETAEGIVACVRELHAAAPNDKILLYRLFAFGSAPHPQAVATEALVEQTLANDPLVKILPIPADYGAWEKSILSNL